MCYIGTYIIICIYILPNTFLCANKYFREKKYEKKKTYFYSLHNTHYNHVFLYGFSLSFIYQHTIPKQH